MVRSLNPGNVEVIDQGKGHVKYIAHLKYKAFNTLQAVNEDTKCAKNSIN